MINVHCILLKYEHTVPLNHQSNYENTHVHWYMYISSLGHWFPPQNSLLAFFSQPIVLGNGCFVLGGPYGAGELRELMS